VTQFITAVSAVRRRPRDRRAATAGGTRIPFVVAVDDPRSVQRITAPPHHRSADRVLDDLDSRRDGLSTAEAARRPEAHGENDIIRGDFGTVPLRLANRGIVAAVLAICLPLYLAVATVGRRF